MTNTGLFSGPRRFTAKNSYDKTKSETRQIGRIYKEPYLEKRIADHFFKLYNST